jgi:dihydroorotase
VVAFDLILKGGRIIDPSQQLNRVADVGFAAGKVAAIRKELSGETKTVVRDVSGCLVTPGLIDLHTHVYWGGTSLGIDADQYCRGSGITTTVDAGSAGPGNFAGFRKHVIEKSAVRILAYLNISFAGIYGFSKNVTVGESEELRLMAAADAIEVARMNRDVIVGIKVRVGRHASGSSGVVPLDIALKAAGEAGIPLMCHIDHPPPNYEDVLVRLRPGDVLTHAFRSLPNAPIDDEGKVRDAAFCARQRGVLFDVGHGKGSFAFNTARTMLRHGFYPDTISSDVHTLCLDGPAFDLVTTLSKFLCIGMSLDRVIAAATVNAATCIKRPNLGTLRIGAVGDASILSIHHGRFEYVDSVGEPMYGDRRLVAKGAVMAGHCWDE